MKKNKRKERNRTSRNAVNHYKVHYPLSMITVMIITTGAIGIVAGKYKEKNGRVGMGLDASNKHGECTTLLYIFPSIKRISVLHHLTGHNICVEPV